MIPSIIRKFIFNKIVKQVRANLYGQGMGRHSRDEIYRFGATDLKALSDYLGDKDYFFGDKPTSIDASIYGILSCMLVPPIETPLKDAALGMENLVAYHARFEQNFNMKA